MKHSKPIVGLVVLFALMAVVMAVVSVKLSPLDQSNAAFHVEDPYLRSSLPTSTSAAGFMVLRNETGADDRLIAVRSSLSGQVALHRHSQDADGVMRMEAIKDGVDLADGTSHIFARGGDHLMFTGLTEPLEQGALVPVTLVFEQAGEVEITVPVDLMR